MKFDPIYKKVRTSAHIYKVATKLLVGVPEKVLKIRRVQAYLEGSVWSPMNKMNNAPLTRIMSRITKTQGKRPWV